jgi:hypothetical protein
MTMKINLPRDVEQAYLAEAQARRLTLDALVSEVLLARTPSPAVPEPDMSAEEWVHRFTAWTRSHEGRNLPILPDEAMSRESIYADRGL